MSSSKYLAFDFGASSGRAILGSISNKGISLEEIHRFTNQPVDLLGHIYWDFPYLFDELKKGISLTVKKGIKDISGIGIDTWGVDFGLISKDDQLLGNPFAYRDSRTDGIMERAFELMNKEKIYSYTGLQFLQFNSIFQLFSMVDENNSLLKVSDRLLFMPDLFNFFLTGEKVSEYTIASTSQLLNAEKKEWEKAIFDALNLPVEIMPEIIKPGSVIGKLLPGIKSETGISETDVIAPACHDTGSAVIAVPATTKNWAYLSSGTWSLMGIEAEQPIISKDTLDNNFTNEGGANNKIRFLKNAAGLWLLQRCLSVWKEEKKNYQFEELFNRAKEATPFKCLVDPDDPLFLNPPDMPAAIVEYCKRTEQAFPENVGEFVRCILESLALKYRYLMDTINLLKGEPVETLHIVGGGSLNTMLNQFTANATGIHVIAGPAEATALGNIIIQAITKGDLNSVEEGRELISRSTELKKYFPEEKETWEEKYQEAKVIFN
ncbi:rhamnulokinase [candidate division KSB1 bacterium]|nr:rhamnulokinase [candidate division KSB1 bacterium]MBL7094225.1 rhamnulokinase [candidate division KSB1 bacterium]